MTKWLDFNKDDDAADAWSSDWISTRMATMPSMHGQVAGFQQKSR